MFTFRQAKLNDVSILRGLEQKVVEAERPFNSSIKPENAIYYDLEDLIKDENAELIVAEAEDTIVATGYAQIRGSKASLMHEHHCYMGFMYTDPSFRGQGLNAAIVKELIEWGNSKGITNFYLDVYAENSSAIKAYEKVGFQPSLIEMKLTKEE